MENNGFDILEKSLKVLQDKKVTKKALKETETNLANLLGVDVGFVKAADKLIEKHGAGWNSSPLILDSDAKVKDPISQLFIRLSEIVKSLQQVGKEDILQPYLDSLLTNGIEIKIEPSEVSKTEESDELFSSINSYIRTIREYDDEIKQGHALEADDINFCPVKEYRSLLGIFQRGMSKGPESIEDSCQDKQLQLEMTETAYNLVYDRITSSC